jgi:8-oxo-dGTP diphosphatase
MYCYDYPHPAVTVDIVIFTVRDAQLKLLLIRRAGEPYRGKWALPGGFIEMEEELEQSARRELKEETGVCAAYLEQLYTFGRPGRDPRERVITVAYTALIPSEKLHLRAASDAEAVGWFGMDELPALAFDHDEILDMARQRLVAKLDYSTIAFQLLGEEFTLTELQGVYEAILQEPVDKRNFRKWVHGLGVIEESGNERRMGPHRPAKLYRLVQSGTVVIIK